MEGLLAHCVPLGTTLFYALLGNLILTPIRNLILFQQLDPANQTLTASNFLKYFSFTNDFAELFSFYTKAGLYTTLWGGLRTKMKLDFIHWTCHKIIQVPASYLIPSIPTDLIVTALEPLTRVFSNIEYTEGAYHYIQKRNFLVSPGRTQTEEDEDQRLQKMSHTDLKPAYQVLEGSQTAFSRFFWLPWMDKLLQILLTKESSALMNAYSVLISSISSFGLDSSLLGSVSRLTLQVMPFSSSIAPILPKIVSRMLLTPIYNLKVATQVRDFPRRTSWWTYLKTHPFLIFSGCFLSAVEICLFDLYVKTFSPSAAIEAILF